MTEKTESLNQVVLPDEGKVKVLNKEKERPQVVYKIEKQPRLIHQTNGKEIVYAGRSVTPQVINPSAEHSHLWVYVLNSGPFVLHHDQQTIKGEQGFTTLLQNSHFNVGPRFYAHPANVLKESDYQDNPSKVTDYYKNTLKAIALPLAAIDQLELYKHYSKYPDKPDYQAPKGWIGNIQELKNPIYQDEFSMVGFSYGDANQPKTLPDVVVIQDNERDAWEPGGLAGDSFYEARHYVWLPSVENSKQMKLLGFGSGPSPDYCKIRALLEKKEISFSYSQEDKDKKIVWKEAVVGKFLENFNGFVLEKAEGVKDLQSAWQARFYHSSDWSGIWFVPGEWDVGHPLVATDLHIYNGPTAELDAFNIMVSSYEFSLPAESFRVIDPAKRDPKEFKVFAAYSKDQISPNRFGEDFKNNKVLTFTKDELSQVVWRFDPAVNIKNRHPEARIAIALGSVASDTVKEITVFYNKAPEMAGETVVQSFEAIGATDDNGDYIPAFEMRLEDPKLFGKVKAIIQGKPYLLGKDGLRYSQKDRADMYLVWDKNSGIVANPADPSSECAKLQVKAADPYCWGDPKPYWVPVFASR